MVLQGPVIICSTVSATRLDASCHASLSAFLDKDPAAYVFGQSVLERWGVDGLPGAEWWGVFDDHGQLMTTAFAGEWRAESGFELVVPMGDVEGAVSIGAALRARGGAAWMVGQLAVTDSFSD